MATCRRAVRPSTLPTCRPAEGHSTRDVQFSLDGKKMFVSVGSASNVDDPDTTPAEKNRADILEFNPDGSEMRVYAYGIRNCVGLAVNSKTGELWCSVNERDGLGDNLVPDYITHVQEGGFYGWPWWYMGGHQDPRHKGKHPELKDKVITPDVILQPAQRFARDHLLRWQAISGGISGRYFRVRAWLLEPGGSRGLRIDSRASASDRPCQRRV